MAEPYWIRPVSDIAASLDSGMAGLTSAAAAAALPATHARAVAAHGRTGSWRLLVRQFTSPILLILIGATVLSGVLGDWTDAAIILTIVLLSGLLDFAQERGAANAMDDLLGTVALTATVLRDGQAVEVAFPDVVPGDVIKVRGGDILPADAMVIDAHGLELDQSSLTGETFPAPKSPGPSAIDAPIAARGNVLYGGTHVAIGSGRALVVTTGRDTEFGGVVQSMREKKRPTGFERGMTRFGLLLARIMVVIVVAIFVVNLVLQRPIVDSALFSLSLAVGLTPQLLPAIVGISLSYGARAIARHRVIVKRLNAIEDFGAMTVLCTDKTGTMTQGSVRLDAPLAIDGSPEPSLLRTAAWNAALQRGLANPLDDAITAAAHAAGLDPSSAVAVAELPYDFDRKRLSVLVDGPDGRLLVTKGAVDTVLAVCVDARGADGTLHPLAAVRARVEAVVDSLGRQGMRALAVATSTAVTASALSPSDEAGLTLVGLLAFADPVKPDAAATVADFAAAGVGVRMITGDARPAAAHIAGQLGLDPEALLSGAQIDALTDAQLVTEAARARVFCETSPHHKERIIRALSAAGDTVGYIGDGINDAPALKAADVGISVKGAADVATEAAAIVMLENDLQALLDGLRQGRRTFANTMKYLFMATSANFGNMISMAIASVVLPFLPLTAAQILTINLLSDLPATAIATDNVDPARVVVPQRWNLRLLVRFMLVFGPVSSLFDILTFVVLRVGFNAGETEFQTAWFLGSILTEVAVIFVLRTRGPFWRSRPSIPLVALAFAVAGIALALPYLPLPLRVEPLPAPLLGLVFVIVVGYVITTEATKAVFWRVSRRRDAAAAASAGERVSTARTGDGAVEE